MGKAGMRVPVVMVSACIGLAAGAAAVGQEGALKPVACDPAEGNPYPRPHTSALLGRKVARGMGAASPKAIYGVARPITATISVAADYIRPDANEPDAIRIAFDGSGRFDPENPLALRAMPSPLKRLSHAEFGPGVVPVRRGGKTYLAGVRGGYSYYRDRHSVNLTFAVAVQGPCRFGQRTHAVRFLDMTGNFAFDDTPTITGRRLRSAWGDVVWIDTGNRAFGGSAVRAFYGQPVLVDGSWYEVTISGDGARAAAKPVRVAAGKLLVPAERWDAILVAGNRVLLVAGEAALAAVPAGTYKLLLYRQWSSAPGKGRGASFLAGMREFSSDKAQSVTVAAGKVREWDIASPLKAKLTARADKGTVRLGLSAPTTRGGLSVTRFTPPGGWLIARPAPPTLRILDAGRLVDTVALKPGPNSTYLRTWRLPDGTKGDFTAELVFDPGFKVEAEKITFSVE